MDMALCLSLVGVCLIAFAVGAFAPSAASAALLANLLVCTIISEATGNGFNYLMLASIDLVTAAIILMLPRSRPQILLAGTYAFGLCCHAAFAALGSPSSAVGAYWLGLYYMAWGQMWITAFWTGGDVVGMARSRRNPWGRLYTRWRLPRQMDGNREAGQ